MSLLFKGRSRGAQLSQISILQRIQMFFLSHLRQALGSLGEMWRAGAASLMTIGVLGLSITLPSTLYILVKNAEQINAGWDQASEISLFLKAETSKQHIDQLLTRINSWPEVNKVTYIPADDALNEFKTLSGFGDAIAYLDKNPLPPVVLVAPTEKHAGPAAARLLLDKLRSEREVDIGKLDLEWLQRLDAILTVAKELVTMIALLLFLAVVLIIGNTIRLNILSKKDELLAWFTVICLLWWMSSSVEAVSALYQKQFTLTGVDFSTLLIMLSTSVVLGLVGSMISVKRHVSAIEPK